jgi:uncharacterized protein (TIGR02391 family)
MERNLKDCLPPPEELLKLEPEEVAGFLLDFLCELDSVRERRGMLNIRSLSLDTNIHPYAGDRTKEVAKIISEAVTWLQSEGMIAHKPGEDIGWIFVTRKGFKFRNKVDLETYRKSYLLPPENLDRRLLANVYPLFIRGDYDTAVFQAFKEVEVRVRNKANLPISLYGVNLMRTAFDVINGPLTDKTALTSEKQAISDLFAGSIGSFKNPTSHRDIDYNNPSEVAEIILFANYLLRFLERAKV